ncbi:hypothetical protein SELMODRAFT_75930, partial [Selaginella moellendorffii]
EGAMELFREMKAKGRVPNIFTFNTVIQSLSKAGMFKEALDLVDEMMRERRECWPDAVTYALLVRHCCKQGEIEQACRIVSIAACSQCCHRQHACDPNW